MTQCKSVPCIFSSRSLLPDIPALAKLVQRINSIVGVFVYSIHLRQSSFVIVYAMTVKAEEHQKAKSALKFIVPIIEKYEFRWVITGGFACYVYGIDRLLTDIDIDLDTSKDSSEFKHFMKDVESSISQPLEHFVDENYDNYNFELIYEDQIIDICPMADLKIFNQDKKTYVPFYQTDFPPIEFTDFEGFTLPLLSKQAIINNKEMLTLKDKWQIRDIAELRKLL